MKPQLQLVSDTAAPPAPILVAVTGEPAASEARAVAAATGRQVIETTERAQLLRLQRSAACLLLDEKAAASLPEGGTKILIVPDPGPIDYKLALQSGCRHAFLLPAQAPELLKFISNNIGSPAGTGTGLLIGVMGTAGGAGTSTFVAWLATHVAQLAPIVLDTCPASPGLDLSFGLEHTPGARWEDLAFSTGKLSVTDLRRAVPQTKSGIAVVTFSRDFDQIKRSEIPGAATNLCAAITSGGALGIIDLAPGDLHLASLVDLLIVLIPAEIKAVAAAMQQLPHLQKLGNQLQLVAVQRAWSGLNEKAMSSVLGQEIAGTLRFHTRQAKACETATVGKPPAKIASLISQLLQQGMAAK